MLMRWGEVLLRAHYYLGDAGPLRNPRGFGDPRQGVPRGRNFRLPRIRLQPDGYRYQGRRRGVEQDEIRHLYTTVQPHVRQKALPEPDLPRLRQFPEQGHILR